MINQSIKKRAIALAIAGATALGAVTSAWSAPVLSSTAALKAAVPSDVSDVRYRGRYRRGGNGAGVALGILGVVGAVAAANAYRNNGYGYGYGNPYYGYGPGYGYGYGGYYGGPANYGHYRGY